MTGDVLDGAARADALGRAFRRGLGAPALWVRLLTAEGLEAGEGALDAVVERFGGDPVAARAAWEQRLTAAVDEARAKAGARPGSPDEARLVQLVTLREGARIALALVPDAAFAAALRHAGVPPAEPEAERSQRVVRRAGAARSDGR